MRETRRIRRRLSLLPRVFWNIGGSRHKSPSCEAIRPLHPQAYTSQSGSVEFIAQRSPVPLTPLLLFPIAETLTGQRSLYPPHLPSTLALMALGQCVLRSHWGAGSHGNLWTPEQEEVRDESRVCKVTAFCRCEWQLPGVPVLTHKNTHVQSHILHAGWNNNTCNQQKHSHLRVAVPCKNTRVSAWQMTLCSVSPSCSVGLCGEQ